MDVLLQNGNINTIQRASDLLMSVSVCAETHKEKIIRKSLAASEELKQMAQEREPLWVFDLDRSFEVLNFTEYNRRFSSLDPTLEEIIRVITIGGGPEELPNFNENVEIIQTESGSTQPCESEASRAIGVVSSNPVSLVNMFMDVNEWSRIFNIVSKAQNLGVILKGQQENPDGVLQVMVAEFHFPSPLVPSREMYFARCCRQLDFDTWIVADVSLENIFPNPAVKCQRRPSGCLIQAFQEGLSMVTWVEHNAICNNLVHDMFVKPVFAFGAKRWISSLERQCDRNATLLIHNKARLGTSGNSLLNLAERMVRSFNANICSNQENKWRQVPIEVAQDTLIKTSLNIDKPGVPCGVSVTIATSLHLHVRQSDVFHFFRCEQNRNKWDILSYGLTIRDIICISSARNSTDCISVVLVEPTENRKAVAYLQESFYDSTGYYVVYAPIDISAMDHIMEGKNSDNVSILGSGFAVLPGRTDRESILTIGFQVMDEELTTPEYLPLQSVLTAHRLMKETTSLIKAAIIS
ncbi:homeobox-leucine zipper PROTODERMAL FACTOR 2-like [Olea europaea subsp. europaea]|uniref:Homeobox-leucine zipper PROTODERMAL FACTOR 2-like n=1 Tax=Olea europaea subsp. europaea TaxID=158383 RepID=A0A8S0VJT6_OLEEU|nr:homeobox-leucine zipper PROTODERMAL FACTOR 2-like [Olea europaea subsp. europaea]